MAPPTIGLALGSGMARGWAHIGVLRVLEDAGIKPDVIVGTSMGAVVGGAYLAGRLDQVEKWARELTAFGVLRHMDVKLSGGGLVGGARLHSLLRRTLEGARFEGLPASFACVATDLLSGHEVWLRKGGLARAMRASFSMPGIFKPVRIGGQWLVDGALVNPVPVSVCHALGAQIVIAVNVNGDLLGKKYSRRPDTATDQLAQALEDSAPKGSSRIHSMLQQVFGATNNEPSTFSVMSASLDIILDRITRSRLAGDPPDISIVPRLGHIALMDFQRGAEIIDEGRAAAESVITELGDIVGTFTGAAPPAEA
ncbi:MAG: patatin-like phospholipase family protein [Proteobacteria bacterium]|nr:patatin-like phospholipase family protein [Pseudomonadota bacterium]MCH7956377.1 patatin-like phospholipase family protein [Pseudomonadota bacterium]